MGGKEYWEGTGRTLWSPPFSNAFRSFGTDLR